MSETLILPQPQAFGRYLVRRLISSGGVGDVFEAHDPLIDRIVAIKIIRLDALTGTQQKDYMQRFRIEAQAGGRCVHPAIVAIFDAGEAEGKPYLVMEFVDGQTLRDAASDPDQRAGLNPSRIIADVLAALHHAHGLGIIHRDIKPANIMLTRSGTAKVADFGIARIDRGHLTLAGDILGTPSYMAPEQATGADVDHRADLFSTAAVLHMLFLGRPPFAGANMADTLRRLTAPEPADLTPLRASNLAPFAPVLERALAKDPAARFASAAEFAAALRAAGTAEAPMLPDDATVLTATPSSPIPPSVIEAAGAKLARHIGPIAQYTAGQAAKTARDEVDFYAQLARSIPDPRAAEAFLQAHASPAQPMSEMPEIPAATIDAAAKIMTVHVGPIARLIAADAARTTSNLDAFIEKLAASVPSEAALLKRKLTNAIGQTDSGHGE